MTHAKVFLESLVLGHGWRLKLLSSLRWLVGGQVWRVGARRELLGSFDWAALEWWIIAVTRLQGHHSDWRLGLIIAQAIGEPS